MKEMQVGVDPKDLFQDRKGDQMVPSKEYRKFLLGQDFTKGLLNEVKSFLLLSQREFQVSQVVSR